jgi:tRNA dimethylallyltransferase
MNSTVASADAERLPPLRIIAGPTGAGKSGLAMELAARHGAVIVSADSRQIYRGFDIGTAKPSAADRARVPHEGIDVADPAERWSAARWAADATGWIAAAAARRQPVLVVGGTGLWLRALVRPLADEPPMDPARREALQRELGTLDTPTLRRWVETLDPGRAGLGRTQLLRAAEVALLTGTRQSEWHAAGSGKPRRAARWLVVDPGEALRDRIARRVDAMWEAGWEREVRDLIPQVPPTAPAWNACGYREIREAVDGVRTERAARMAILVSTRQYAKRQRTWFRNQLHDEPAVTRLDPRASDAAARAERWFLEGDDA